MHPVSPRSLWSALQKMPREARDTLFTLAVIAWVLMPQINHVPLWCSLLTGSVLCWSTCCWHLFFLNWNDWCEC